MRRGILNPSKPKQERHQEKVVFWKAPFLSSGSIFVAINGNKSAHFVKASSHLCTFSKKKK